MIELIVNGDPFTDFVSARVTESLSTLANDFSFTASSVGDFPPLRQGDEVEAIVDGVTKLTGTIDEVNGRDQEGSHLVTYTGRDKTGDFLDSQINVIDEILASDTLTLKRIIEITIAHLKQTLTVEDDLNPTPFNSAEDIIAPQVGQNAFDFVAAYARKRQALLSSTPEGNILITQSSPTDSGAVVQRIQGADDNNIVGQNYAINASRRFNKHIHRGQLDPSALNFGGESSSSTVEDQGGEAIDSGARVGRQSVTVEAESYSSEQLKDRAKWAAQLAKAKATRFACTVNGHQKAKGGLWVSNTLVQVNSDVADITRKMLLDTVTFSQGEGQPTVTDLEFVERNVYTIDEKISSQKPTGDLSDAFKALG